MLTLEGCTMVSLSLICPRAAPQAHGLSPGFNGFRWIILVFFSDMNNTSISSLWGYFPLCVCRSLLLAHLVVIACMHIADRYRARAGLSVSNLKDSDHWLLHLILGKSKCEKSLLQQYLYHQVGSRMFMKAVWHITCNLQTVNCCISDSSMLPGGKRNAKNYLALHLFPQYLDVANQSLKTERATVPKVTGRNEKSLCTVRSLPTNMPHSLWSRTAAEEVCLMAHNARGGRTPAGVQSSN